MSKMYQARAWKRLSGLVSELAKTDEKYKEFEKMMSEISMEEYSKRTKGEEVADIIADFVNIYAYDQEGFVKQITEKTHRTLQGEIFTLFMALVNAWAEFDKNGWYDIRNENAIKQSVKIKKALGE